MILIIRIEYQLWEMTLETRNINGLEDDWHQMGSRAIYCLPHTDRNITSIDLPYGKSIHHPWRIRCFSIHSSHVEPSTPAMTSLQKQISIVLLLFIPFPFRLSNIWYYCKARMNRHFKRPKR